MNYENYRIFYFVGKHKNITRAAQELYTSQPAITRSIQKLESDLNCRLFVRSKNGVEFTREGQRLFEFVSLAHSQLVRGEEEVSRAGSTDGGTIFIATSVTALYCFLFDFLTEKREQIGSNVKFDIHTGSNNGCVELLKNGVVDLAFVSTPCRTSKNLSITPIKDFQDILIAGNNLEHLRDQELERQDLCSYSYVSLRKTMQLREFIDMHMADSGVTLTPNIELDSANLIVPMVSHNFGIGFIPDEMAKRSLDAGEVFRVKLREELPRRSILMVHDSHHPQTAASRQLMRIIHRSVSNAR